MALRRQKKRRNGHNGTRRRQGDSTVDGALDGEKKKGRMQDFRELLYLRPDASGTRSEFVYFAMLHVSCRLGFELTAVAIVPSATGTSAPQMAKRASTCPF